MPMIESRASKISRDEGNTYTGLIESWDCGSSDMIIDEYVGVNMGFEIPLLIIDRRSCLHILKPVVTRVNSINVLNEGLRIGGIGHRMNSKVRLIEISIYQK
jgi:hypothetical protein